MTIIDGTVESTKICEAKDSRNFVQVDSPSLHKAVAQSLPLKVTGASVETFPGRKQLATAHATPTSWTASGSWHVQASIALPVCRSIKMQPTCTYDIKFRCPTRGYALLSSG